MEKQILITFGRESGSGGFYIAKQIAEELGIPFYDKNLLDQVYEEDAVSEKMAEYEEKASKPFITRHVRGMTNSIEENVAKQEFKFIKDKAAAGESFVVVGRCSGELLKDYPCRISIFVLGDLDDRVRRVMAREGCTEKEALEIVGDTDRARRKYHNQYCKSEWGDAKAYDVCINVSRLGTEQTAEALMAYIKRRYEQF